MGEANNVKGYLSDPRNAIGRARNTGAGVTERGQSAALSSSVLSREASIRNNRDESMHVFDADGNEVVSFGGKGRQVEFDLRKVPENAVITHNHPGSIGERGILSIGNSFSYDDIKAAVKMNAREIRAVTPRYTFSLKRPEGGWGKTVREVRADYAKIFRRRVLELQDYAERHWRNGVSEDRANTVVYHSIVRELARANGWTYTKKKG